MTKPTMRYLDCGCVDQKRGQTWVVLVLCALHMWGRVPVQDKDSHAGG